MDEFLNEFVKKDHISDELEYSRVYRYLDKYMTAPQSVPAYDPNSTVKNNRTVWTLWLQGIERRPALVKKCMDSVESNLPEGYDYIILTEENLKDYISLPDYIFCKYKEGFITKTHLSDLIRVELLSVYGGCWIDATVFCSEPIRPYMLSGNLFFFQDSIMVKLTLKMSSWWIYSVKDNPMIKRTRDILYEYWKSEYEIKHYYLLHIAMSKLFDEEEYAGMLRNMPYFSSSSAHVLWGKMNERFSIGEWEIIKEISPVHKMSNKQKMLRGDIRNYYSVFMEGGLK